jgi:hypothetical protein
MTHLAVRRCLAAALGVLLLATTACQATPPTPPDTAPTTIDTTITPTDLQNFLDNHLTISDHGDFGLDQAQLITTTDAPGGTMLRISYPAGSASRSAGGPDGGTQAYLHLPGNPIDTLDLTYQLRFPPDFDFVKGGKLPGLYGGTVTSGQHIPDGTNGFSTRYMWRAHGDGEVYAYLPTSHEHGTSLGRGCWTFTPGRWTTIRQHTQLNTPGHTDGRITIWQDDRQVLDQTGLEFRTTDQLHIDGLFFSTFFGGDDTTWASPTDQYADFAEFTLSTEPTPLPAATELQGGATSECASSGGP